MNSSIAIFIFLPYFYFSPIIQLVIQFYKSNI